MTFRGTLKHLFSVFSARSQNPYQVTKCKTTATGKPAKRLTSLSQRGMPTADVRTYIKTKGIMKMKLKIAGIAAVVAIMHGCASHQMQTAAAPISAAAANRVVDGKTTRFDVIAMFGEPNGYSLMGNAIGMMPMQSSMQMERMMQKQFGNSDETNHLMHYKDCVLTTKASVNIILPVGKGSSVEVCKVFTALLDDNDVVVAHVYLDNNIVTKKHIGRIKPNVSSRKDVIQALGGPTSINRSGNREIYLYRNCIGKMGVSSFGMYNQKNLQSCQQAGIAFDSSGTVTQVSFIPWNKATPETFLKTE
jgi:hypothetical protein